LNRNESVEKARLRIAERLKDQRFYEPKPEDYPPREGAFALRRHIGDYHALYLEAVFGREGKRDFFRLNIGFGPVDAAYDDLPLLGDDEGKGIRMPFFRAILVKKLARIQQRLYNLFVGPPAWNHAASDTFYYSSDEELLNRADAAASLVLRVLPEFIERLKRNGMKIPRLKSPYKFARRLP